MAQLNPILTPSSEPALHRAIMIATSVYIALMATPFVPGAEIGFGLMMTFGPGIAPLVYASTVVALSIAFLIGRMVPEELIIDLFRNIRMARIADLLNRLHPLSTGERLTFLLQATSWRALPVLLRYRFLILMLALNLPGNSVIGGGGGICLVAGFCRLFSFPSFIFAVALAVAPVPLLVYLTR